MNDLALTAALATAPASAFVELRERPRFWFPLLLIVATTLGITFWYYSIVDIDWLKDALFGNNPKLHGPEREAAMGMVTRTTLLWGSLVGIIIAVPAVSAVTAAYWLVAAKVTKLTPGYKHWFAFSIWTSMPLLIVNVIAAILLAMSDSSQIGPGVLQPLSMNELFFHRPLGSPGQTWLDALHIPGMLSWVLMVIGVHTWSQRSWLFATAFVAVPIVAFYGIWAAFAFR